MPSSPEQAAPLSGPGSPSGGRPASERWHRLCERLVAGLAHELKNPLHALALSLQLIEHALGGAAAPERLRRLLAGAGSEIERCRTVLDAAVALVRRPPPQPRPMDLVPVVAELVQALSHPERGRAVRLELPPAGSLRVLADPEAVREATAALIENALEALPGERGEVQVRLCACPAPAAAGRTGAWARCEIRGPVAAPLGETVRARAFEPFFTTKQGHLGLGLSRARLAVEALGGRLELEDAAAGTTRAWFELPLVQQPQGS
ncbi:MAG: hypothetical protein KatS3mg102_1711 [Planctomycetota bacterium]|nr:MAG: hypothetical protein KatS3mg102_1711 [Planctomycetota bacterium]